MYGEKISQVALKGNFTGKILFILVKFNDRGNYYSDVETAIETRRSAILVHKRNARGQARPAAPGGNEKVTGTEPLISAPEKTISLHRRRYNRWSNIR